jgi:TRAP-type C4-dicarboxylate transport system permease large subunit
MRRGGFFSLVTITALLFSALSLAASADAQAAARRKGVRLEDLTWKEAEAPTVRTRASSKRPSRRRAP